MDRARRAASGLAALGVGAGDVIAVYLRNDFAIIEANVAASLLGAYSTPVLAHPFARGGLRLREFRLQGDRHPRRPYFAVAAAIPDGATVFIVETPPEVAEAYGLGSSGRGDAGDREAWDDMISRHPPRTEPAPPAPGAMIYTSGTTGNPKGVRHAPRTPAQIEAGLRSVALVFGATPPYDDIISVVTGPMYHSVPNGFGMSMFRVGANVILEPRFDPEGLLALIERERVTHMHVVPTMFVRLLKLPEAVRDRYDLSSLRCVAHGAAPCPVHVKHAMIEWLGPIINEYYGGTETGAVTFCNSARSGWAHPGTVGHGVPGAETSGSSTPTITTFPSGKPARWSAASMRRLNSPIMAMTKSGGAQSGAA